MIEETAGTGNFKMNENNQNLGVIYDKTEYAGIIKRIIIAAVDTMIILIVTSAVLYISDYMIIDDTTYIKFNFIFFFIFSIFYLALLKRSKIRTLGYTLTGVKIVDLRGKKPSIFNMVFRAILLLFGPFELIFDIIWLMQEPTRQTLRDKYTGTYVINKKANPVGSGRLQNVTLNVLGYNKQRISNRVLRNESSVLIQGSRRRGV